LVRYGIFRGIGSNANDKAIVLYGLFTAIYNRVGMIGRPALTGSH
jgi:hypothetical protein